MSEWKYPNAVKYYPPNVSNRFIDPDDVYDSRKSSDAQVTNKVTGSKDQEHHIATEP